MPELPDVEVMKRQVDATALGRRVARVHVLVPTLLKGTTAQALGQHLKGRSFQHTHRHGKFLFLHAEDDGWLLMHFGMSGSLAFGTWGNEPPDYTCLNVAFEDDTNLAYVAPRKLGRLGWTADPKQFAEASSLGPDAAGISLHALRDSATGRKGNVKSWLMNQAALAGIGNIYSDEILFQAGIHPASAMTKIDDRALERIHKTMQEVIGAAIKAKAEPAKMPKHFLLPNRKEHAACPKCNGALHRMQQSGRTAYYCPACQHKL